MTTQDPFQPAIREQAKLKMALTGPSGSGKSYTALEIATALVTAQGSGRIAVIDAEGRRSRAYASKFVFNVRDLGGDYHPDRYIESINDAVKYGYSVLVIDGISPAWNGKGGVLQIVDEAAQKMGGNKFGGWASGRPAHAKLVEAIKDADIHIIATMRSKTEWKQEPDRNGKLKPVKVGVMAIQSEEMEYEFEVAAHLDMQHKLTITKSIMDGYVTIGKAYAADSFVAEAYAYLTDGKVRIYTWASGSELKRLAERIEAKFGTTLETVAKMININEPSDLLQWNTRFSGIAEAGEAIKTAWEQHNAPPEVEDEPSYDEVEDADYGFEDEYDEALARDTDPA